MGRNCCHVSLAFVLKFFNFLQAFIGISIIIYSIWMLDQWNHNVPVFPPSSSSSSSSSPHSSFSSSSLLVLPSSESHSSRDLIFSDVVRRLGNGPDFDFNSFQLPAPWFIYSFMGVGAILCCIAFIGCIAAESINGCCLCFYTIVKILLILLEAVLVAFIAIDRHWEKDLPFDPTGELQRLHIFIEENVDICKWVGITVLIIQALALLLAMILRAMVSTRRNEFDEDDFENVRRRTREPLLIPSGQTFGSGTPSDIWSSRMREKYGLNTGDKPNLVNQNASVSMKST